MRIGERRQWKTATTRWLRVVRGRLSPRPGGSSPMSADQASRGRGWAYTGALLGGAVSVAANRAHSYVPPDGEPEDWQPHTGAVAFAVFWPIALFVAVEILARIPWPDGWWWTFLRYCGLVPVALVAAIVSYQHMRGLLIYYGEDGWTPTIGPLAVDGLMILATGALIATGRAPVGASATAPATVTDTTPAIAASAMASDTASPEAPRKPAPGDNRAAIARTRKRHPHMTQKAVAAATGMSVRTVARHWPHTTPLTAVKEA